MIPKDWRGQKLHEYGCGECLVLHCHQIERPRLDDVQKVTMNAWVMTGELEMVGRLLPLDSISEAAGNGISLRELPSHVDWWKTNFHEGEGGDAKTGVVVTSRDPDWRRRGWKIWRRLFAEVVECKFETADRVPEPREPY